MVDGTRITCQEVVEVVTDYLEGRMPPDDVAVFEAHLELCDGCKWYVDQMRVTIATVGRIEETDVPDAMRDTLTAAFRRRTAR
jgi:anti-sigma factor RsiW